jgi:hypothetical protein
MVGVNHRRDEHSLKAQWLPYNNSKVEFENSSPLDLLKLGILRQ